MARGIGENPAKSPAWTLQQVDYPATRDELVDTAADSEAPPEVINFLKALPKEQYASYEECLRDFGEAERRFGDQGAARDSDNERSNINRVDPTQHP